MPQKLTIEQKKKYQKNGNNRNPVEKSCRLEKSKKNRYYLTYVSQKKIILDNIKENWVGDPLTLRLRLVPNWNQTLFFAIFALKTCSDC